MSMKYSTSHNIICLEAEWEYTEHTDNKFSLNTQPMLNWLKESYECDIIYRRIRTKADLKHYLDYFNNNPEEFYKYDLIYIACHGENFFPLIFFLNEIKSAYEFLSWIMPVVLNVKKNCYKQSHLAFLIITL